MTPCTCPIGQVQAYAKTPSLYQGLVNAKILEPDAIFDNYAASMANLLSKK